MKKLLISFALVGCSLASFAQEPEPVLKHSISTNSFWSNWFVQLGGDYNSWISNQEHSLGLNNGDSYGLFDSERTTFGGAVAIGKWFTPSIGLRTKLQMWKAKQVGPQISSNKFNYWMLNEHIMFNLSNLLYGYNPNRVWNLTPFVGGGISRNCTSNLFAMQLSAGINSSWKICNKLSVYTEFGYNRLEDDFDGVQNGGKNNSRGWNAKDNNLYAEVGITMNIGKGVWNKTIDADAINSMSQSQLDALNAQLADLSSENVQLRKENAKKDTTKVTVTEIKSVKEFVTTPISIFFNIGKIDISSLKDLVNVRALAKYAIENKSNILVTGYADAATGTPEINKSLSLKRANTVVEQLVLMGVSRDNIKTAVFGGSETLKPIEFNRRATVQITE
ncbi:MAG: OmpA family protein [Prevotella sp.]|nr:OmpA family protein [Prevotella sp.]